jgi:hypothetical protein
MATGFEILDSKELATRLKVPRSWVSNHVRGRVPKEDRIPHLKLGRYTRFEWQSPRLEAWIAKQRHKIADIGQVHTKGGNAGVRTHTKGGARATQTHTSGAGFTHRR